MVLQLAAQGSVSDRRYASERVRVRCAQGVGPLRILAELREKGVESDVITAVLSCGDSLWSERAREVRLKRFGEPLPADRTERARQARFLHSRGFSYEQITVAVTKPPT